MSAQRAEAAVKTSFSSPTATGAANWLAAPSRFATWSRPAAILALLLLAMIELTGLLAPRVAIPDDPAPKTSMAGAAASASADERPVDLILYDHVIDGIRDGQSYYAVAASELRRLNYPLRPFVVFRPPWLAELLGHMPAPAALILLRGLVAATVLAWAIRLREATGSGAGWTIACLLFAGGVALCTEAQYFDLHEVWAGVLIALSLALRTERRWVAAAIVGLFAALVRELALPYLAVMAVAALYERKWPEVAGWVTAIGLFAIATAFHAAAASAVATAADHVSQGWSHRPDWTNFLHATWRSGPLKFAPYAAIAILTPLSLLGWAGWREPLATRAFLMLAGYAVMLTFFGRPDNFYWALMFTPTLMVGLTFAPRSLGELIARARRPARVSGALQRLSSETSGVSSSGGF